jgi:hypothetical protein
LFPLVGKFVMAVLTLDAYSNDEDEEDESETKESVF